MSQLDFTGAESEPPAVSSKAPLNDTQRAILKLAAREDGVRAVEAGVLVHMARADECREKRVPGKTCCQYASSDGSDALKRLAARGLLKKTLNKRWVAANG